MVKQGCPATFFFETATLLSPVNSVRTCPNCIFGFENSLVLHWRKKNGQMSFKTPSTIFSPRTLSFLVPRPKSSPSNHQEAVLLKFKRFWVIPEEPLLCPGTAELPTDTSWNHHMWCHMSKHFCKKINLLYVFMLPVRQKFWCKPKLKVTEDWQLVHLA